MNTDKNEMLRYIERADPLFFPDSSGGRYALKKRAGRLVPKYAGLEPSMKEYKE